MLLKFEIRMMSIERRCIKIEADPDEEEIEGVVVYDGRELH